MFTASHNPARYNGIKLCLAGAVPLSLETGLARIRDDAMAILDGAPPRVADTPGTVDQSEPAGRLRRVPARPRRSVRHPAAACRGRRRQRHGRATPCPWCSTDCRCALEPLYFDLDGSFPNHEANPLDPANLVDLQAEVRRTGADIGLAFDGDADRCFVVDEKGEPVSPSAVTALVAVRELAKTPRRVDPLQPDHLQGGARDRRARPAGSPIRTRVGHSFIKAEMARTGAVFGGEHSAHYYFTDFFRADTGMLAAMHVLAALGGQDGRCRELAGAYQRYAASGEINSTVTDSRRHARRDPGVGGAQRRRRRRTRRRDGQPARRITGSTSGRATPSRCFG